MAQALDLPLVREVGRKELMLGKIMGINPKLPSWGTPIVALIACQLLSQLPHPHNDTQSLMSHLLALGFVLIVWNKLQGTAESQDRCHRLKRGVVAGLSETFVLVGAGVVHQSGVASSTHTLPLGWLCAMVVLLDQGILAHARIPAESDWVLQRLPMARCVLLLLGIASHWLHQMTGTAVFSMGTALVLILALGGLGCVRRYLHVARSLRPPSTAEVRPGLEVQA